jgi:uncharacterized protein (DUF1800 family)
MPPRGTYSAWSICIGEVQRDLKEGHQASIARFLDGKQTLHSPADFTALAHLLGEAAVNAGDISRLKAWWCYRILFTPDPLREKMALLWHNHFATGNAKVKNPGAMKQQNECFRKHAFASFATLLNESVRQPALLEYLDAPSNRKGHPNENLARELMELFTLGVGHFTETDVKEAARCLTGWSVSGSQFTEVAARHDPGVKTVLGKTGAWDGRALVNHLLEQDATAQRIAGRLCEMLMGENAVTPAMLTSLAAGLQANKRDLAWGVRTIVRSQAFFATSNIGTRVLSPVEYALGVARRLEMFDPAPSTLALGDWCARMGQDLFEPPNVGGWKGGRTWISARSMIARANFATALVDGSNVGRMQPYEPAQLAQKYGSKTDANDLIAFHSLLTLGAPPSPALVARVSKASGRQMVVMICSGPEAQLG